MQGEIYKPRQAIPHVLVPLDIEGWERRYVNIYLVAGVRFERGRRYHKGERRGHILNKKYIKKHPIKSCFWNPFRVPPFGYFVGFVAPKITIYGENENLMIFECRSNKHAKEVCEEIKRQLGMV
jgi:hypothetical protein